MFCLTKKMFGVLFADITPNNPAAKIWRKKICNYWCDAHLFHFSSYFFYFFILIFQFGKQNIRNFEKVTWNTQQSLLAILITFITQFVN